MKKTETKSAKKPTTKKTAKSRTMWVCASDEYIAYVAKSDDSRRLLAYVADGAVYTEASGRLRFDPDSLDDLIAHLQRLAKVVRKVGGK